MTNVTALEIEKVTTLRNALRSFEQLFPDALKDQDSNGRNAYGSNAYGIANFLWVNIFPLIDPKIERISAFGLGFHRPTWTLPDVPQSQLRDISLEEIVVGARIMSSMLSIPWD